MAHLGPRYAGDQLRLVQPPDAAQVSGQLVLVTTWVRPDVLASAQPCRASGRLVHGACSAYVLGGLVVMVAVVATLVTCLATALLALVNAHAVAVGAGIAAVVVTALLLLPAPARARSAGPPEGCCR